MHTKRWTLAGTALATLALTASSIGVVAQDASPAQRSAATPATPTGFAELDQALAGEFADAQVTMQTQWITAEGDDFAAALDPFRTATGIDVTVAEVPSGQHEQLVNVSLNGGVAADIIALAQPAAIIAYGEQGLIKDVATLMDGARLTEEHPATVAALLDWRADLGRPLQGRRQVDGLVSDQGLRGRRATRSRRRGTSSSRCPTRSSPTAASPGATRMESAGATGWITTDWIEDILLRTAGKEFYNKWITHETAVQLARGQASLRPRRPDVLHARLRLGWQHGHPGHHQFLDAMDPMFDDGPREPRLLDAEAGRPGTARLLPGCEGHRWLRRPSTSSARTSGSSTSRRSTRPWARPRSAPAMRFMVTAGSTGGPRPRPVPRRRPTASRPGSSSRQRHLREQDHAGRVVRGQLQARDGREHRRPTRRLRLRRVRPDAASWARHSGTASSTGCRRTAPTPTRCCRPSTRPAGRRQ